MVREVVSGSLAHSVFYPSDVHNKIRSLGWQVQKATGRQTSEMVANATEDESIRKEQPAMNDVMETDEPGFAAELVWIVTWSSEAPPENSITKAIVNWLIVH